MATNLQISMPSQAIPLVDPQTGMVTPVWYWALQNWTRRTGGPIGISSETLLEDVESLYGRDALSGDDPTADIIRSSDRLTMSNIIGESEDTSSVRGPVSSLEVRLMFADDAASAARSFMAISDGMALFSGDATRSSDPLMAALLVAD